MSLRSRLSKPHLVFRPRQTLTRVREARSSGARPERMVVLPWGASIECRRDEHIGSGLARMAVYDLAVSEVLARLIDPGETVVDAGANIGYMTSLMAWRAGASGHVLSFEPNPQVLERLQRNVSRWRMRERYAAISVFDVALSESEGRAVLRAGADFAQAMGTASLTEYADNAAITWDVDTRRLDDYVRGRQIGVLKLDVESHELSVLRGTSDALAQRQIRDLLLEDHEAGPSDKLRFLQDRGFTLFGLDQRLLRPSATRELRPRRRVAYDPQTYLATLDPDRASKRLRAIGWTCLNPRLFPRRWN